MNIKTIIALGLMLIAQLGHAVTGRNPTGVNVEAVGSTSVFITFQGTQSQRSFESFWCGELTGDIPSNGVFVGVNPCVPGTIFGHLPRRLDQSRNSGVGTANLTDIMTIPASVTRRAYQAAKDGAVSSFFYVRKFTSDSGPDEYVVVTCRMAGGGARVPFALMKVVPYFSTEAGKVPVHLLASNEPSPAVAAMIYYNGTGRLKGRWEVVKPGDPEPTEFDLLPESSLPVEDRGLQKRYTVIDQFNRFLPPTGRTVLPGPPVEKIPTDLYGPYKILLRIEPTNDKEGNSNTGQGTVNSGGLSGFPMPVLRYFVASPEEVSAARRQAQGGAVIELLNPPDQARVRAGDKLEFSWSGMPQARLFRLDIRNANGEQVLTALNVAGTFTYAAPPWLLDNADGSLQWRVTALDDNGVELGSSEWRTMIGQ